jgi:hypothetical protein
MTREEEDALTIDALTKGLHQKVCELAGLRQEHAMLKVELAAWQARAARTPPCKEWCGKPHCAPPNFCFYRTLGERLRLRGYADVPRRAR